MVFLAALLGSFGSVLIKKGADAIRLRGTGLFRLAVNAATDLPLVAGVLLYGLSMVVFVLALRGGELSVLYPLVATSYIWVVLLARLLLGERMDSWKWAGVLLIIAGVALVGLT